VSAPLVGVSGPARGARTTLACCTVGLWAAGARVRLLRPSGSSESFAGLDAVVIGGGVHIEPGRYAEQPSGDYTYDAERDELEWRLLEHTRERALPVLGICRGAQLLNVFYGGTLFQDLAAAVPGLRLTHSARANKWVDVDPDSTLGRTLDVHRVRVNSLHSQGIRQLGRGLRVCARDEYGLVQAVETAPGEGQLVGVQWHPEYLLDGAPHRRLFAWLVRSARGARS
jgi:putative glutamine amidotransferase